jgi:hypothetical protein
MAGVYRSMMTPEERTKLVRQLVVLASENMDKEIKDAIQPTQLGAALDQMADNVVEQILGLDDSERIIVAMATVTKLLVENYILQNARQHV